MAKEPQYKEPEFVDSPETVQLRAAIGQTLLDLERLSGEVHTGQYTRRKGLDITALTEYKATIVVLSALREAAARKYHEQFGIPYTTDSKI